ncbi:unnamed protein product [Cylindrotheca closterium]|uniref:gamma-glutamylcyclotransferase n=1 Tax=Cylindrotheca closterium TaxID=2856 RepID=A0AAD2FX84_9STRA|nr:unnamed protein product [Cylindrotheca closterium]
MKRNSFSSLSPDRLSPDQMSVISSEKEDLSQSSNQTGNNILFFGYGPIVNEIVRKRRNIRTTDLQAAFLDGYRLSFEFGGVANVVRQRGYRVHGVLMTLTSLRDFKKLQSYDIRRQVTERLVFHYPKGGFNYDEDEDTEEEKEELASAMAYFIEFPDDVQETLLSNNPVGESLPQEGYLKLIAEGMQQNRIMREYIEDSILNIPYIPDRCVDEYLKFPNAPKVARISFSTYQNLCETSTTNGELYFVLGDSVFSLGQHDPNNPLVKWLEEHGHGKGDITFWVQIVLMNNSSMPFCRRRSEVTPAHVAWAENQLRETIQQHGLEAMKIFEFVKENESEDGPSKFFTMEDAAVPEEPSVASHESGGSLEDLRRPAAATNNRRRFKVSVFFKRIVHRNR